MFGDRPSKTATVASGRNNNTGRFGGGGSTLNSSKLGNNASTNDNNGKLSNKEWNDGLERAKGNLDAAKKILEYSFH